MTREKYIQEFKKHLKGLPEKDISEAISDINEHFIGGLENNRTEDEIASALSKPKHLAYSIKAEHNIEDLTNKNGMLKSLSLIPIFIGLGMMNLLMLPLMFSISLLVLSLYLTIGALYLTGFLLIVAPILKVIFPSIVSVPENGLVFLLPILGLAIIFICMKFQRLANFSTKKIFDYSLKYLKYNTSLLKN